jgi:hypothetical protein
VTVPAKDVSTLRAEHDALARQLSARRSIDEARKAIYSGFLGALAVGTSVKLAFDRWFSTRVTRFRGPPVFFYCAATLAVVAIALSLRWWIRSRRQMRVEDEGFARMRALRDQLELDP